MSMLRRSPTASSCSSINTNTTTSTQTGPDELVPRKRVSPAQAATLKTFFGAKSHPSREERVALAREVGMELKAVTIWFQNKRQSVKRSLRSGKENAAPPAHQRVVPLRKTHPSRPSARPLRATVSLDHFAERCQRPSEYPPMSSLSLSSLSYPAPPLTPRSSNTRSAPSAVATGKSELWKHMLSSPIAPPSPVPDISQFSMLSTRSKRAPSLEWACAKARVGLKRDENYCVIAPRVPTEFDHPARVYTDDRKHITPRESDVLPSITSSIIREGQSQEPPNVKIHPSEELDAAMVLLDFMSQP